MVGSDREDVFNLVSIISVGLWLWLGLNYLQYTSGCEQLEDGTVTGKRHYAFNGRELISFDLEHSTWVAVSPYAESTQRKWNSNAGDNEYKRYYTKKICIEWLNNYLRKGAAVLNRK
eukprot:g40076.t1